MNAPEEIFCPVCKLKNEASASICAHCQSPLTGLESGLRTTKRLAGVTKIFDTDELLKNVSIPKSGVVIVSQESGQEIAVVQEDKFVLGRSAEGIEETVVDLSAFGAYGLGVSRLHVLVQKTKKGYEISDMDSTNGSWLNDEELVPNKFYSIRSGDNIRMGKLYLIVLFNQ
ncbi:MAG: FHA domain-containing protein [Anaerolineales bacterium]|nr:FHA domain-containing protein [Anaerolineales bacterium]